MGDPKKQKPPGRTIEARENQLISLAVDLAEKQLREGTASSQVISFYLKQGSTNAKLEKTILEHQAELIKAKTENLHMNKNIETLYNDAISAMRTYRGENND